MLEVLPYRAFFRFELPIHRLEQPPRLDGDPSRWPARHLVPPLVALEGRDPVADVYWAWNNDGFFAAFDVPGRSGRPHCDPKEWWKHDGIRLCISTRETADVKRATRFCHFFYLLPMGGGPDGRKPVVGTHRMSHAREAPPPVDLSRIRVVARVERTRYCMEVAIPADCLTGWDPVEHPRIGVYYKVKDHQRGAQHLSADDELGWNVDPSTWATGVLL